ncbi:MAG TPA: aminotransferase class III-fold pyridoxal phosphate-dependent enzyme [Anaerolineae bacterium]|nr:aminotransferase class III-fold pyridoxal phosphate-dependent enzyme [Anaerolineae bacterium]
MTEGIAHLSPVWARYSTIVAERAGGAYIYDVDGDRYLDFTSGIGVTNTGHCHPKVVEAARDQVGKFIHAQANLVYHQPMIRLVEELLTVVPEGLDALFFSNSGAEAVEASLKLARQATGRTNLVVFQGSFHGRTVGTMSLTTSKTIYRVRYQPLMAGVFVAPYAYCYTCPLGDRTKREGPVPAFPGEGNCGLWCLKQVRHLLVTQTAPEETAAMIVEPVLGEGGYVVPPLEFIRGLREICDEHGILLIIDEVQAGFGRTGKFFAIEHFGVAPDIMIMAKGLASGFPLSGIAARRELMDKWIVGSHGGTYGGNAVACAAAAATIRVLKEEGLIENSTRMGEFLRERLGELQRRYPVIGDVRGLGLMVATEFTAPDGEPDKATAKAVQASCLENKLMLLTCGPYDNVIRWIPPLIITQAQLEEGLGIFEKALASVVAA